MPVQYRDLVQDDFTGRTAGTAVGGTAPATTVNGNVWDTTDAGIEYDGNGNITFPTDDTKLSVDAGESVCAVEVTIDHNGSTDRIEIHGRSTTGIQGAGVRYYNAAIQPNGNGDKINLGRVVDTNFTSIATFTVGGPATGVHTYRFVIIGDTEVTLSLWKDNVEIHRATDTNPPADLQVGGASRWGLRNRDGNGLLFQNIRVDNEPASQGTVLLGREYSSASTNAGGILQAAVDKGSVPTRVRFNNKTVFGWTNPLGAQRVGMIDHDNGDAVTISSDLLDTNQHIHASQQGLTRRADGKWHVTTWDFYKRNISQNVDDITTFDDPSGANYWMGNADDEYPHDYRLPGVAANKLISLLRPEKTDENNTGGIRTWYVDSDDDGDTIAQSAIPLIDVNPGGTRGNDINTYSNENDAVSLIIRSGDQGGGTPELRTCKLALDAASGELALHNTDRTTLLKTPSNNDATVSNIVADGPVAWSELNLVRGLQGTEDNIAQVSIFENSNSPIALSITTDNNTFQTYYHEFVSGSWTTEAAFDPGDDILDDTNAKPLAAHGDFDPRRDDGSFFSAFFDRSDLRGEIHRVFKHDGTWTSEKLTTHRRGRVLFPYAVRGDGPTDSAYLIFSVHSKLPKLIGWILGPDNTNEHAVLALPKIWVILESVAVTNVTSDAADVQLTQDSAGRSYTVVTDRAAQPDPAQIIAGTDENDSVPVASGDVAQTAGVQGTIGVSGLPGGTTLYAHCAGEDTSGNATGVTTTQSFTTATGSLVSLSVALNAQSI